MAKSRFGAISLRMYVSYGLAYAVPLLVLLFLTFDLKRVEYFKYFFPKFGNDIDILSAITIDRNYTTWENGLRTFYTVRTVGAFEEFNKIDKDWESFTYDLNAGAKEQTWIDALRASEDKRKQVLKMLDDTAQPVLALQEATDKIFLPYSKQILDKTLAFNEMTADMTVSSADGGDEPVNTRNSKRRASTSTSSAQKSAANEVLKLFNVSLNLVIRYALTGERTAIADARQSFLQLENALNALPSTDPQLEKAKNDIRSLVDNFYKDFDALDANHKAAAKAGSDFNSTDIQNLVKGVNPLLGTEWRSTAEEADSAFIERSFKRMNYFLIIGFVVLSIGLVYSFVHVYTNFQKPFYTILSYLSHGFISRKRSPVPCQERTDDIGLLARTLNAFLERAQGQIDTQQNAAESAPESNDKLTVTTADTQTLTDTTAPAIVYQIDPSARSYMPRIETLLARTADLISSSDRMTDAARRAAERAQESGVLAEETRKAVQEGAAALQDLVPQLEASSQQSISLDDSLGIVERHRSTLSVKIRSSQMTLHKLRDSARALYQFANNLEQEANIQKLSAERQSLGFENNAQTQQADAAAFCKKTAEQLMEALEYVEQTILGALATLDEAYKFASNAESSLMDAQAQSTQVRQKQLTNRDALLQHYSKLQTAAFQAGRLALLLLDVASDIMGTEKNVSAVKALSIDISQTADDIKKRASIDSTI